MKRISKHGLPNQSKMDFYLLFILPVFILSCKSNQFIIDSNEVESVHFWFVHPSDLYHHDVRDCIKIVFEKDNQKKIVTDRKLIERYVDIINHLKPIDPKLPYDLRTSSLVRFKQINGERKPDMQVCISPGGNYVKRHGRVLLNGVLMRGKWKPMEVFFQEVLYDPLTPYDWLPEGMKEYLKDHPEEIDNILPKSDEN